ncbi:MAG: hypothetical protein ACQETR_13990, partial [Thermodesulfobacteriota bacterium]
MSALAPSSTCCSQTEGEKSLAGCGAVPAACSIKALPIRRWRVFHFQIRYSPSSSTGLSVFGSRRVEPGKESAPPLTAA